MPHDCAKHTPRRILSSCFASMNSSGYLIVRLNTFIHFGSVVRVKAHLNNAVKYSPQSNKQKNTELARKGSVGPMAFVHSRGYREMLVEAHECQASVSQ